MGRLGAQEQQLQADATSCAAATATTSSIPATARTACTAARGNDRIIAYYGHGTIDCGPGKNDYAQTRWQSNAYKVRNCELIRHFCAFGSKPNGDCKKPGESASPCSASGHSASLWSFLDAW